MAILILQKSRCPARTHLVMNKVTNKPNNTENTTSDSETDFRGFVIEPGADCCQASLQLQKLTFCYRDRVVLPLPSCDKNICSCQLKEVSIAVPNWIGAARFVLKWTKMIDAKTEAAEKKTKFGVAVTSINSNDVTARGVFK